MRETKMSKLSLLEVGSLIYNFGLSIEQKQSPMKEIQYPYPEPFSNGYFTKNNK